MQLLTLISLLIFVGFAVVNRITSKNPPSSMQKVNDSVLSETTESTASATPAPPVAKPRASSQASSKSTININVNNSTQSTSLPEQIVYPGASTTQTEGGIYIYETGDSGETVYDWYKSELEKRAYKINVNVKTRANDRFKAIVAGANNNSSIKITIDQENSSSKTSIRIE